MLMQTLLNENKLAYILINQDFTVYEWAGYPAIFMNEVTTESHIFDLIPELMGCEDILQDIIQGILPDFTLHNLNRTITEENTTYLDVKILLYHEVILNKRSILVLLIDKTEWTQIEQQLTQQHNELRLLKHNLDETNKQLEFILQHYVPREVSKALKEKRIKPQLGGELREVTVLFIDLRNYTSISETQTPAETIEMLHVCLDVASTAVVDAGGVIVNYMGDALMALFNAPNEQPDHALRAVQASLTLQDMAKIYQEHDDNESLPMFFGVGINTGEALVGNVGAMWHYQYTAIGDTVNVASRLCSTAKENEVLIGEQTFDYVKEKINTESLHNIKLKGKSQLMTAYKVLGWVDA